jgi:P27 family predicted phage terminase small subunit
MSRAKANPTGNPSTAVDVSAAPTVHTGRAPRVPANLGRHGKEVWRDIWQAGAGAYLPATDGYVIERYCELHDRRAAMLAEVEADGYTAVGSTGQTVAHPLLTHITAVERQMSGIEASLGLNLEARLRLGLAAGQVKKQSLDSFLDDE